MYNILICKITYYKYSPYNRASTQNHLKRIMGDHTEDDLDDDSNYLSSIDEDGDGEE